MPLLSVSPASPALWIIYAAVRRQADATQTPRGPISSVISGAFYIGLGDRFDGEKVQAYPPGSVIVLPGDTFHFHWAKSGEYVTQVTANGPLASNISTPATTRALHQLTTLHDLCLSIEKGKSGA